MLNPGHVTITLTMKQAKAMEMAASVGNESLTLRGLGTASSRRARDGAIKILSSTIADVEKHTKGDR